MNSGYISKSQFVRLNGVIDFLHRLNQGDNCRTEAELWEQVMRKVLKEIVSSNQDRSLVETDITNGPAKKAHNRKGGNHKKRLSELTRKRISKALKASHKRKKATGKKTWQEEKTP